MSYEHRSNVQIKRVSFPLKVLSVIIIILIILNLFVPQFLPYIFSKIAYPFWTINSNTKIINTVIPQELTDATILELRKENNDLKEILNRRVSSNSVVAYILKKPPFSAYDSLIIDIGIKNGISIGDKVYAMGNIIIGEISEVNDVTSKVKLYSSYGEKYDIFIGINKNNDVSSTTKQKNIQATATGRGGGSFEIIVPRDVKVEENDIVTIPSLTNSVFGIVKKIIADPARAYSTILFSQPINIYEQKWVEVDKK